jgi:hypothetical protein
MVASYNCLHRGCDFETIYEGLLECHYDEDHTCDSRAAANRISRVKLEAGRRLLGFSN